MSVRAAFSSSGRGLETKSQHHFPPSASAVPSTDSRRPKGPLARTPHRIYPYHPLGLTLCPMEPLGDWLFLAPMTTVALTGTLSSSPTQPIRSLGLTAILGTSDDLSRGAISAAHGLSSSIGLS